MANGIPGSDDVGAFWNEQDWETYHKAEPGLKVHVQATNALGIYYTTFFITRYQPWRKLIGLLVTASATCLSVSLLFFLDMVLPPRRQKTVDEEDRRQRTAATIETPGGNPPELAQPLPRRVKFRKKDRTLPWIAFFLPLPFLLIGSFLVLLAVWLGMERSFVGCVVVSIAALVWNALWLWIVYEYVSERWITRRLCQWGRAAEGSIVKTSQKGKNKSVKYYLHCQYRHPGLGLKKMTIRVTPEEYARSDQGRRVTVLCYAYLPWPRQVYEVGNIFRCY